MARLQTVPDHGDAEGTSTTMTPRKSTARRQPDAAALVEPHDRRPEYLRRDAAARFLGLAPGTLANWASAGTGPAFHRVGRIPLYDLADLRRYVESSRVRATGAA
jgi:hypothetical protein